MTSEYRQRLSNIRSLGILTHYSRNDLFTLDYVWDFTVDELAWMRYEGQISLGQYATFFAISTPWMGLIEQQ